MSDKVSAAEVIEGVVVAAKVAEILMDLVDGDHEKAQRLLNEEQVRRANRFANLVEASRGLK